MKPAAPLVVALIAAGMTLAPAPLAPAPSAPAPSAPAASAQPAAAQPTVTQAPVPAATSPEPRLSSTVFEWDHLVVEKKDNGVRRNVLDGPTATLDRLHAHITTLKPGERSGEPSRHKQEEVIVIREGTVEAQFDGQTRRAGPGSVIFFASNAVTSLRNVGTGPATYTVVYYYTPLTPRS